MSVVAASIVTSGSETLLKLTRWMADYYLCGWGQVLNIVLPAGAKKQAGTVSVA